MAIFEDIERLASVIAQAYEAAFRDSVVLQHLQSQTATLAVHFQQEDYWWGVTVRNGEPAWQAGKIPSPDVTVVYTAARIFHSQFWDAQQFMQDALAGEITISGSMEKAFVLQPLARAFQEKYLELTQGDAPPQMPPIV